MSTDSTNQQPSYPTTPAPSSTPTSQPAQPPAPEADDTQEQDQVNEYGSRRGEGVDPWRGTGRPADGGDDTETTARKAKDRGYVKRTDTP